jgi:hypothetical protein
VGHLPKRTCTNPACARRFRPTRRDQITCTSDCRSEKAKLKREGITTREAWKARERAEAARSGAPGTRPPTSYAVFERRGMIMFNYGRAVAHDRESAIREVVGEDSPDKRFVAIPTRALAVYGPDGSKL